MRAINRFRLQTKRPAAICGRPFLCCATVLKLDPTRKLHDRASQEEYSLALLTGQSCWAE